MEIALRLRCDERFRNRARYVLSCFCEVLGLDQVDLTESTLEPEMLAGPMVWYGDMANWPSPRPGLICIHASPEAPAFFAGTDAYRVEDIIDASWQGRRVPFLFHSGEPAEWPKGTDSLLGVTNGSATIAYDLIASAFFFLSRWEETVIPDRDQHGRFPYARSLAAKLDLSDNIVDTYLDIFVQCLSQSAPERQPSPELPEWGEGNVFAACLTHDVDEISKARLSRLKFVWDHLNHPTSGHRNTRVLDRAAFGLSTLFSSRDPYWTFPVFADTERRFGFTASYFFQAGNGGEASRYSLTEQPVRGFVSALKEEGFEVGLHGTYRSAFDEDRFIGEKRAFAKATGEEPQGHRQHYLRMDYTRTLPIYENASLQYDTTLGYAEHEGFRNEFSYPYQPYCHQDDRPFRFWELPTVIMDATLAGYRELSSEEAWEVVVTWLRKVAARRGCLTLLWHNLWEGVYPNYFNLYPRILAWIQDHGGVGLSGRDVIARWKQR